MKLACGTAVFLRGCEEGSPAYEWGVRLGHVGWVCGHWGMRGCCPDPSECSIVEFISDTGFQLVLCVQDAHMEKVVKQ
jgi:hypothetical protein